MESMSGPVRVVGLTPKSIRSCPAWGLEGGPFPALLGEQGQADRLGFVDVGVTRGLSELDLVDEVPDGLGCDEADVPTRAARRPVEVIWHGE